MKKIVMILSVAGLMFASSCTKCTTCTKSNGPDVRFCEKDFGSHTEYGLAIDAAEGQGYNCKKTF